MGDEVLDVRSPGPLLRLVHSLERRRAGRSFVTTMRLTGARGQLLSQSRQTHSGPRAFVVGNGAGAALSVPGDVDGALLPRHLAILAVPLPEGVLLRVLSLHPERGMNVLPSQHGDEAQAGVGNALDLGFSVGGVLAHGGVRLAFDGVTLEVRATLDAPDAPAAAPEILEVFPLGQQAAFFQGGAVRPVGDVVSSVTGPGGLAAIPALVHAPGPAAVDAGTLVLRARTGVHRVDVNDDELSRGLLVGRSRRCVLGRGFDENDGLSRVHALVVQLPDGVWAFDLASRYGLRDVSRPNRLLPVSRLDDGIGCLVWGAGVLSFEH